MRAKRALIVASCAGPVLASISVLWRGSSPSDLAAATRLVALSFGASSLLLVAVTVWMASSRELGAILTLGPRDAIVLPFVLVAAIVYVVGDLRVYGPVPEIEEKLVIWTLLAVFLTPFLLATLWVVVLTVRGATAVRHWRFLAYLGFAGVGGLAFVLSIDALTGDRVGGTRGAVVLNALSLSFTLYALVQVVAASFIAAFPKLEPIVASEPQVRIGETTIITAIAIGSMIAFAITSADDLWVLTAGGVVSAIGAEWSAARNRFRAPTS